MEIHLLYAREEIFVQQGASFVSLSVTKQVVTQGNTRYQMKDINIIFPLMPLSFLKVEGSLNTTALQRRAFFSEFLKILETDHF